jgi:hypothetical protein
MSKAGAPAATCARPVAIAKSSTMRSPANASHVSPASGQATWIIHNGSSASSEMRFRAFSVNSQPNQMNMPASTSTATFAQMRSAACRRGPRVGHRSTSKCVPSRMPSIAPSMIDQTNMKRAISSVQM